MDRSKLTNAKQASFQ